MVFKDENKIFRLMGSTTLPQKKPNEGKNYNGSETASP
jgi:hypothetical protein